MGTRRDAGRLTANHTRSSSRRLQCCGARTHRAAPLSSDRVPAACRVEKESIPPPASSSEDCVRQLQVPRDGGQAEPSPAEPRAAPTASGPGRSPLSGPHLGAPAHGSEGPRRPRASVLGFLARLIPTRGALGPAKDAEFDASEREAYRSALEVWGGPPLAPAPLKPSRLLPGARSLPAPTTESRDAADASRADRRSAWAAPPRPDAEPAILAGAGPEGPSPSPRRLRPGETAPDSLFQAPTSVSLTADDFFDGLIRRVEGDR